MFETVFVPEACALKGEELTETSAAESGLKLGSRWSPRPRCQQRCRARFYKRSFPGRLGMSRVRLSGRRVSRISSQCRALLELVEAPLDDSEVAAGRLSAGYTAGAGGVKGAGIVWSLTPGTNLWTDPWTETILYNFCWNGTWPSSCADGTIPTGVLLDASGNIYGTTEAGGNGTRDIGNGVLYVLLAGSSCTEGGTATFMCETVEHSFCNTTCADGSSPP